MKMMKTNDIKKERKEANKESVGNILLMIAVIGVIAVFIFAVFMSIKVLLEVFSGTHPIDISVLVVYPLFALMIFVGLKTFFDIINDVDICGIFGSEKEDFFK